MYIVCSKTIFVTLENEAGDVSKYKYSIKVSPEVDEETANGKFLVGDDKESYLPMEYFASRVFEMNTMFHTLVVETWMF